MEILGFLSIILGPIMKFIYSFTANYGWTIILFTILVRVVSFPLALHSQKTMAKQSVFMPMVQEIQTKYRNDAQKQNQELQRLQEDYGYNPTGGCMPQLLNMLILFGVINVIYYPLQYVVEISRDTINAVCTEMGIAYAYTAEPQIMTAVKSGVNFASLTADQASAIGSFNMDFLGINLCETPSFSNLPLLIFPMIALVTMVFTNIYTMKASGQQLQGSMKYMPWMMSAFFAWFCFTVPVAFALYYSVSNVLMLAQTLICKKIYDPEKFKAEYAAQIAAKKAERKKRKTVEVMDKKTGAVVTKEVGESELNKLRLERARQLDAEKYSGERTRPLSELKEEEHEPAENPEKEE